MASAAQGTGVHPPAPLGLLRFSAGRQRHRLPLPFGRLDQKSRGGHTKDNCQGIQRIDGDILRTALDAANVRSINLRRQCQPLLRQTLLSSQFAEIPANDLAHIHCGQEGNINGLTIDGLTVPYSLRGLLQVLSKLVTKLQGD